MTDAQTLTGQLGGRWLRSYGIARCPAHDDRDPSLSLRDGRDGRLLLHCHAGCAFEDIAAALGLRSGDWRAPDPGEAARRKAEDAAQAAKREQQALRVWREAQPIEGTPAETYLRGRAITCPMPESLRFHPECWHGPTAQRLPAMVARVDGAERFAVHRTYLRADGGGKAQAEPAKMMLGTCAGGAVRLTGGPDGLAVAEGIETSLSLACGLLRGRPAIWAALSTGGMAGLALPRDPGRLIVATDGDPAGHEAGHKLAIRAHALGWRVSILPAPEGRDWADILTLKGGAA